MLIVSLSVMLVKRESTSRLSIQNSETCSAISSAKANDYILYALLQKQMPFTNTCYKSKILK